MIAVWLATTALASHSLGPVGATPHLAWLAVRRGDYLTAAVLLAPGAVAAGLLAGGWAWSLRLRSMAARAAGRSPPLPSASTSGNGAIRCAAHRPGSPHQAPSRC